MKSYLPSILILCLISNTVKLTITGSIKTKTVTFSLDESPIKSLEVLKGKKSTMVKIIDFIFLGTV